MAAAVANNTLSDVDADNEDSWLYGSAAQTKETTEEDAINNKDLEDEEAKIIADVDNNKVELENQELSTSLEIKDTNNNNEDGDDKEEHNFENNQENSMDMKVDGEVVTELVSKEANGEVDGDVDSEEGDDDDDDIQVTIGDIKLQSFDQVQTFKGPYQRQGSQGIMNGPPTISTNLQPSSATGTTGSTTSSKPMIKGVDLDAIGSVNGVSVYEFDLESIKIEDKPWRKPGADITDYFNYGFTEDTWMKYCERQRRMRIDNNCKTGLIMGQQELSGITTIDANTYLGQTRKGQQIANLGQQLQQLPLKSTTGIIDVIGGTVRDSRRPQQQQQQILQQQQQQQELGVVVSGQQQQQQQQQTTNQSASSTIMPITMSVPPPMLAIPPPDFNHPPPSALPPGMLTHPPMVPPSAMMPHPPILVAPPNFVHPPMAGQYDFYRPQMMGGPPPATSTNHNVDRRAMVGYADRPTFRLDNPYAQPPPHHFQLPPGMPPPTHWKVPGHMVDGYMVDGRSAQHHHHHGMSERNWARGSPHKRSHDSDISSSSGDESTKKSKDGKAESAEKDNRPLNERTHPNTTNNNNPSNLQPSSSTTPAPMAPSTSTSTRAESRLRSSRDRSRIRDYEREYDRRRGADYDSRSRHHHHHRRHHYYRRSSREADYDDRRKYSSRSRREDSYEDRHVSRSRHAQKKPKMHNKSDSSDSSSDTGRRKRSSDSGNED